MNSKCTRNRVAGDGAGSGAGVAAAARSGRCFSVGYRGAEVSGCWRIALVLLVVSMAGLVGCAHKGFNLGGKLVYVASDTVEELNLETLQKRTIYTHGKLLLNKGIAPIDNDAFLVSDVAGDIYLVAGDGSAAKLGHGQKPVYLPKSSKILYFAGVAGKGPSLFEARLSGGRLEDQKMVVEGPLASATPVAISEDEVVFEKPVRINEREFRGELYKYDVRDGTVSKPPVSDCRPHAWRATTGELLCWNPTHSSEMLVSLDGRPAAKLEKLRGIVIGPYLPSVDKLLGGRARWSWSVLGEIQDLVVYDFTTGDVTKLAERVPVSAGNAFYRK